MTRKKKYRSPTKRLMDECDQLVREIIKKRDGRCVICGRKDVRIVVGHLIKRGRHSVRWALDNVNGSCDSCNYRHNIQPEHYEMWYMGRYGAKAYMDLIERSRHTITRPEIEAVRDELKRVLETV